MHDLRKKALLESGKTVSKKARSHPDSMRGSASHSPSALSPASSRNGSRNGSRAGSRYASEEDDMSDYSDMEDSMTASTNSVASEDAADSAAAAAWVDRLQTRVAQILAGSTSERKRIGVMEREDALKNYLHLIRHHYATETISKNAAELVDALIKTAKVGGSGLERSLALKCLAATVVTCPTETAYETVSPALQIVCSDDEDEVVKADAIWTLAVSCIHGDGDVEPAEAVLEYLMDVIESDGEVVSALDNAVVVTAALEAWGFVAGHLADLSEQCERAMDAFADQLNSADIGVQTSAGSNIALLFEASREHEEETGAAYQLAYDPKKLVRQMKEISRGSKSISKKDRRHLRSDFNSIATALELGKGPRYSTAGRPASNPHTGGSSIDADFQEGPGTGGVSEFGYREKIRIGDLIMVVDSWSLLAKVEGLKRILAGGFGTHFIDNPIVRESLDSAEAEVVATHAGTGESKSRKVVDHPKRSKKLNGLLAA